jgi:succinate dehydrogenase / fumarate reductase iron-sulfur subunit
MIDHAHGHDDHGAASIPAGAKTFLVRILRQDGPDRPSYWERHRLVHEPDMNVTSVLQRIAAQARTAEGRPVCPVAYESNCLEEVCGSCTMLVNGRVRQGCSALVDRLLEENAGEIELRPMSKYPVVRDLVVERSRLFRALTKVRAWIEVDGYYDAGPGPRQSQEDQEAAYPLSQCMSCGCCVEACPQYVKVELAPREGESPADFEKRSNEAYDREFIGPHAISQAVLFNTHPTGRMQSGPRIDALTAEGGVQVCGNSQNCVAVCPKSIPLTTSIARAGRAATVRMFTQWFDR